MTCNTGGSQACQNPPMGRKNWPIVDTYINSARVRVMSEDAQITWPVYAQPQEI